MKTDNEKIILLGAGISGLTVAYYLKKAGCDILVLEAGSTAGGSIRSENHNGFLVDYGPNSSMETTPGIGKIVDELNIREKMIYANKEAGNRYILKKNQLIPLPASPVDFIKSRLFSTAAKLRLLKEPFVSRSSGGEESVADFVRRRLGQEFLDYAVNPFVAGIFAGDPERLSVKAAFPKLHDLEKKYGGLIKGALRGARERKRDPEKSKARARMFSFKNGMQCLPDSLAAFLENEIKYKCTVLAVEKAGRSYVVTYKTPSGVKKESAGIVISTVQAYQAAGIFKGLDEEVGHALSRIHYPPVMTLFLGFKRETIGRTLDGFGFLIPEKEQRKILGAIWSSTLFPFRAPDGSVSFTLFIGGSRDAQLFTFDEETLVNQAVLEFKQIMKVSGEPVFIKKKIWRKAIPQYNMGHAQVENQLNKFEKSFPGIILAGNYRGGISVGDCIRNGSEIAQRILSGKNKKQV